MIHDGGSPATSWTRRYDISTTSNRLLGTSVAGDDPGEFSAPYTYDEHGNMTSMPHLESIEWNHRDEMVSADKGGGGMVYFTYDAAGQQVRKVYEHSGLIEERIYLGGFEVYRKRVASTGEVTLERQTLHVMDGVRRIALVETKTVDTDIPAFTPTTVTRLQLGNHLGSASLEVDLTGLVISYEEYHPYGTTAYHSATSAVEVSRKRYRYTGKERDEETGLYYHGARYYAPWLGRWTAADPAGLVDGVSLYRYARANPIKFSDPSGTESAKEKWARVQIAAKTRFAALEKEYRENRQKLEASACAWDAEEQRILKTPTNERLYQDPEGAHRAHAKASEARGAIQSLDESWGRTQAAFHDVAVSTPAAWGTGFIQAGPTLEQKLSRFNAAAGELSAAPITSIIAAGYALYASVKNKSTGPLTPDQQDTLYTLIAVGSGVEGVATGALAATAAKKQSMARAPASPRQRNVRTQGIGEDVRPAEVVREIKRGERFDDITKEVEQLTRKNNKEYAWVVTADDKRVLVTGGLDGINFGDMPIRGIVMHSHPPDSVRGHSRDDSAFIRENFQKSSWLLEVHDTGSTRTRYTQQHP